jgi:Tripartite tricarboxylate transporter family receptor
VVIENRAGANTIIAAQAAAKAAPDGYTLLMAIDSTLVMNQFLYKNLPYDPLADFAPISLTSKIVSVLAVSAASGPKTVQELIARAKAQPGKLNYGGGTITAHYGCPRRTRPLGARLCGGAGHPGAHLLQQYERRLVILCCQRGEAAQREMRDCLDHARQALRYALNMWVESEIGTVGGLRERAEGTLRCGGGALLENEQARPCRSELSGLGSDRFEIAVKPIADDNDGLHRFFLEGAIENTADRDETAAHALAPCPSHEIDHVLRIGGPACTDIGANLLLRTFGAKIAEPDVNRPGRKYTRL